MKPTEAEQLDRKPLRDIAAKIARNAINEINRKVPFAPATLTMPYRHQYTLETLIEILQKSV